MYNQVIDVFLKVIITKEKADKLLQDLNTDHRVRFLC